MDISVQQAIKGPDVGSVWRRTLRDIIVELLALQTPAMKVWEMRHFGRIIWGVLLRLEKCTNVISWAGPAGRRFRMRLSWEAHTYYVLGFYEPELIRTLKQCLHEGDTCLDVGGHVGYLTIIMSQLVGGTGRVITFEPVSENVAALKENVELNSLKNVTVQCAAVGDSDGIMELICAKGQNENLGWTASAKGYSAPEEKTCISVPMVSLDSYVLRNDLRPRLIKIDVEGAELMALQGVRQTLLNSRPLVLVEIHDLGSQHKHDVLSLLRDCGYTATEVGKRNREVLCLAVPSAQENAAQRELESVKVLSLSDGI